MKSNKIITNFLCLSMVFLLGQSTFAADTMWGKKIIKSLGSITYKGKSYKADLVANELQESSLSIDVRGLGVLIHGFRAGLDQVLPIVEMDQDQQDKSESILCRITTKNKAIYLSRYLSPDSSRRFNFTTLSVQINQQGRIRLAELDQADYSLRCFKDYESLNILEGAG